MIKNRSSTYFLQIVKKFNPVLIQHPSVLFYFTSICGICPAKRNYVENETIIVGM